MVTSPPPLPMAEMVQRGNYGYNMRKGYFIVDGDPPPDWEKRHDLVKQLQILGAFNTLINSQKMKYTDNSVGQALTDVLLVDEIREFRRTGSAENCTILQALAETGSTKLTVEALATKLWLQYESFRMVVAYLYRLEHNIRELMYNHQFDKATELLNNEAEKMMM
jgi:hypothetical protein